MIIAGLDIGAHSVRLSVAEIRNGNVDLIDLIQIPSEGVKKGIVVNLETVTQSIRNAVYQIFEKHELQIQEIVLALGGIQIESKNSTGVVAIEERHKGVTPDDIKRVLEAASAVPLSLDSEIIHSIPNEYTIDGIGQIMNPINMLGVRLELDVHIIAASSTGAQGLVLAANRAGLVVSRLVYSGLASSKMVLSVDEYELGAIHVVIGHDTTTVICIKNGGVCCSFVIPIGGRHITNDLAIVLQTSLQEAERIKLQHGVCYSKIIDTQEEVLIRGVGGHRPRLCTPQEIARIIEARILEIFDTVKKIVNNSKHTVQDFHTMVISGGGALHLGITELIYDEYGISARIGIPRRMEGLDASARTPVWSTSLGLIVEATEDREEFVPRQGRFGGFVSWIKNFFE